MTIGDVRALAILMTVVALALVAGGDHQALGASQTHLVIRVKSTVISGRRFDAPPQGLSKGDRFVATSRLVNVARQFGQPVGAAVGTDFSVLTLTSSTTATVSGTATFPGGTIRFRGSGHLTSGASPPIPVVGGTGRYAGARGNVVVGPGTTPLNTYRLTLP